MAMLSLAGASAAHSATSVSSPAIAPLLSADVNQDGQVNVIDVQLSVNVYLGIVTDPEILGRADVNQDGEVDVLDIQSIVNTVLGPVTPVPTPSTPAPTATVSTGGRTWYVSLAGDNSDGRSWETAWNEMDQIDWGRVSSGDVVLIDGGSVRCAYPVAVSDHSASPGKCGMVYKTALRPRSGVSIIVSGGTVIIFGGRDTPLPYCGQTDYNASDGRNTGLDLSSVSNVVIDGLTWGGIKIYGHGSAAVDFSPTSSNILVRNVEIYDNGLVGGGSNRPGVDFSGTNIAFERALVHDNGQDSFQSGGGVRNFTLRESWLYNMRRDPGNHDRYFNHRCTHSDGVQIWGGGTQSGVLIEDSIIGPGFIQGILLGNPGPAESQKATVNDVVIRNSLFFKSTNNNIATFADGEPQGWVIENVTSYRRPSENWWNIYVEGSGHIVHNSVFYGGRALGIDASHSGNCSQYVEGGLDLEEDPLFANVNHNDWFSLDDFTVQNPSCVGSSIATVNDLLNR